MTNDDVSKVCITTIQRLYSVLRGVTEFDSDLEEEPCFDALMTLGNLVGGMCEAIWVAGLRIKNSKSRWEFEVEVIKVLEADNDRRA